ncbi:hypothetical protein K466DRAFT_183408 [Polyporus arcularius HHB13444]|uniref:Uncharacterized protein n=1 Tax=Polyporus arcularius HHB13444 TaxID=1314778 RepID=A0A5C3PBL7_9APHY|nr:hypothetical protein K466DRAFT_183408 [Polyporus arcularius HHB13444]
MRRLGTLMAAIAIWIVSTLRNKTIRYRTSESDAKRCAPGVHKVRRRRSCIRTFGLLWVFQPRSTQTRQPATPCLQDMWVPC